MGYEDASTRAETQKEQLPAKQLSLSNRIAEQYLLPDADARLVRNADVVLKNPINYLKGLQKEQLPRGLQEKWHKLLDFSEAVAKISGIDERSFSDGTTGLEKIQTNMNDGNIDPNFRGTISDVLRVSSELFAESYAMLPDNNHAYYMENVEFMDSLLAKQATQ